MAPQFELSGLITAIVSAGILTFAIVYVTRSRRGAADLETPLIEAFTSSWKPVSGEMFAFEVPTSGGSGFGLAASIALHVVLVFGTPFLPYLFPEKLPFDPRRYNVKVVEFRVPQRLMHAPAPAGKQPSRPPARVVPTRPSTAARKGSVTPPSPRPRFQVPDSPRARSRDVVIQPDQPPEIAAAVPQPLPRTFLWAQAPTPVQETRTVGAAQARPATPKPFLLPHTQPALQRPNRELAVGDLQVGAAPVLTFRPPQLPVPAANVTPISVPQPDLPGLGELPATPLPPGNPMNLIALLRDPAAAASGYMIGVGNRLPEPDSPGGAGQAAASPPGGADAAPSGAQASAAATSSPGTPQTGTHAGLLAESSPAAAAEGTAATKPAAGPGKDRPVAGRLGVVIVQQTSAETGLEGSEVLTGQPVYTVFLDVPGSARRWVLQYCVPGSVAGGGFVQSGDATIRVVPRRTVRPPNPVERVPVDASAARGAVRRLVLYARIDEQGLPHDVRVVRGAGLPVDQAAVAALQRWTFLPAARGSDPVAVEALFGIPVE